MIKLDGVTKKYDNRIIINNISFTFENNKFYSIIGASGSGKSTLLYLLSGLEKFDSGIITYDDINYDDAEDKIMAKLRKEDFGFIFQFYNLIPNINVVENILMPMYMSGVKRKAAMPVLNKLAQRLGIDTLLNKYPAQLSGGEQQRVAIARALINNPKVVFADEPTGNLDSKNGETVINLILEMQKELGFMLIMVTHNNDIADKANIRIKLSDGQIINVEKSW